MGPVIDKSVEVVGRVGSVVEQAGPVVENVRQVLATVNEAAADMRPRISKLSDDAVAIAHSSRQQVERIGALLNDASGRARARLEQIDESVESTVEQVGKVGDAMKSAVMRPVREANGIAAGISAAVSTLVKGPRKSSVDSATQDEEMFI
jgi:ABC-type transporter Mla subunit MlaD